MADPGPGGNRAFVDLHCHTRASFDSLSSPTAVVRAAADRGLTHLAITDHDRIDGALEARELAPEGLTIIVGQEIRTAEGDLIAAFLSEAIPVGLPAREAIARVREQGGLVGIPHPFDRFRGSLMRDGEMAALCPLVDWIETHNARLMGGGNAKAAELAMAHGRPGVAVSDAHTVLEVGVAYTAMTGDPSTPDDLLAALSSAELVPGRASMLVRAITPLAKVINRARGNRRVSAAVARPGAAGR